MNLKSYFSFATTFIVLSLITSLFSQQHIGAQLQSNFQTYENPSYDLVIKYPSDWQIEASIRDGGVGVIEPNRESMVIFNGGHEIKPEDNIHSLDDLVKKMFSNSTKLVEKNTDNYFLLGHPAARIIFTMQNDLLNRQEKAMSLATIINNTAYTVVFTAPLEKYNDYLPIAQTVIDSYQLYRQ